ncbi:MAG: ABC transporter ATP-binding protein [Spirochaetaceae bacterium]|jgi:multiple sugar transport system ATP-binding protein|nr:ABC transporter ATP-binding protein [Spirochaetaceae bacterium]
MAYLELKDLQKKYHPKGSAIVNNLNLDIEKGEFIVLLGPSGCGKTTIVRMIAGLEDVTGGDIVVNGTSIKSLPPKDRGVSMIFQSYAVWPHMTVFENIAYPLKFRKKEDGKKYDKDEIKQKVHTAAAITNIDGYLDRYPAQLSGGQRQRVAVSRSIVVEPDLFLMDEPLSNLDAMLRVSTRTELKSIHEKIGSTSIFVTHDQSEAMSLADRIVIMRNGVVEQIGTPNEVYNDCETVFVASFIGSPPANFYEVTIKEKGGILFAENAFFNYKLPLPKFSYMKEYAGKNAIMGVRSECYSINGEEDEFLFKRKIDFIEPQGSHLILIMRLDDGTGKVNELKIMTPVLTHKSKDEIRVGILEGKVLFFDSATEKRIRG